MNRTFGGRVLLVSAEATPLAKQGGLADMVGALARALRVRGVDARVVLPLYAGVGDVLRRRRHRARTLGHLPLRWQGKPRPARIVRTRLIDQVPLYLVDEPGFFSNRGVYADPATGVYYDDNTERFLYFSVAVAELATGGRLHPHLLHLHDHHTAAVASLLAGRRGSPHTLLTLHNLVYQGTAPADLLNRVPLPRRLRRAPDPLLHGGRVNLLRSGIVAADGLTTVSPTYAREILTPEFGAGLETDLQRRARDLRGILNGIDTRQWNPRTDRWLARRYDSDSLEGKRVCRAALRAEVGLPDDRGRHVLVGLVSRLADQKGWDLIAEVFRGKIRWPLDLVILGSGAPEYQRLLHRLKQRNPERVAVRIGFDEGLAHRIEAGCDAFLMPSRYEPCGLNQMYSLRYGTLPVVRRTGGLADTVSDMDEDPDGGTGFVFGPYRADALRGALDRMCTARADRPRWSAAVRRAMAQDFSWERSARAYTLLYEELAGKGR